MTDSVRELAGRIAKLEAQLHALSRGRQIVFSTVEVPDTSPDAAPDAVVDMPVQDAITQGVMAQQIAGQVSVAQDELSTAQTDLDQKLAQAQADIANIPPLTTSTDPPSGAPVTGAIWRQVDSGGTIIGQWRYDGTVWQSTPIGDAAIGTVGLAKLVVGVGEMGEAVIEQLYAAIITTRLLLAQKVITSDMIADTVIGKIINGGTITGAVIQTSTSNTRVVMSGDQILFYDGSATASIKSSYDGGASGGNLTIAAGTGAIDLGHEDLPFGGSAGVMVSGGLDADALYRNGAPVPVVASGHFSLNLGTSPVAHPVDFAGTLDNLSFSPFTTAPRVIIIPDTQFPANVQYAMWSTSTSGFTWYGNRTDSTLNTGFDYIAVGS